MADNPAILTMTDVSKHFGSGDNGIVAVRHVSLNVFPGECLAVVGESGSGKTTLAGIAAGLTVASAGQVILDRVGDVQKLAARRHGRLQLAQHIQFVFQSSMSALDPSMRVRSIVAEPIRILGWSSVKINERVAEVLESVRITQEMANRRPRELSGGERQRVNIARALASRPRLLILDEPVASLDVSIQGQVLSSLASIREVSKVALLIISHDLGVVRALADRALVMYRGSVVEEGSSSSLFQQPAHPYTRSLIWSASAAGRRSIPAEAKIALAREASAPISLDTEGCVFRARCWRRLERCNTAVDPHILPFGNVSCNAPLDRSVRGA